MKILGKTGYNLNGVIVELNADELANLCGHYSAYQHSRKPNPGDVIEISTIYKNLRELSAAKHQFDQARKILLAVADNLELVEPVVLNITDQIGPVE